MKKIYESPSAELCNLIAREATMTNITVSDNGYGWSDEGPVAAIDPVN